MEQARITKNDNGGFLIETNRGSLMETAKVRLSKKKKKQKQIAGPSWTPRIKNRKQTRILDGNRVAEQVMAARHISMPATLRNTELEAEVEKCPGSGTNQPGRKQRAKAGSNLVTEAETRHLTTCQKRVPTTATEEGDAEL
ncbi:hypothetical protein V492_05181 [Pseudogymnoascus sp. VKM F-4246]|nr:hypothetical protein V492_05181 [Pseudogymnoascus sp. VKM F-4246]